MNNKTGWQKYFELIPILIVAFVLFKIIDSSAMFSDGLSFFLSIFSYFIWAFVISYFLNPLMMIIDRKTKGRRWITLLILYAIVFGCIALTIRIITPRLVQNINDLVEDMPEYYRVAEKWIRETITQLKLNDTYGIITYLENALAGMETTITETVTQVLNSILGSVLKGTNIVATFLIALILSVYMLKEKEVILDSVKKLIKAVFRKNNTAHKIFRFAQDVDDIFSRYMIGKVIDSMIIGFLCYIGLVIMRIPYAIVLGLIVGVTNMIPYFGPFIGMIPAFVITLFSGFWSAIATILFIFLLQQFDGWYLGPRILGGSVGLSPLWIIMAITLGGKLYGIPGMFLGVPAMAVIKKLLNEFIESRNV